MERSDPFLLKLRQCSVFFDLESEETKSTLFELGRYLARGGEIAEAAYPEIVKMVRATYHFVCIRLCHFLQMDRIQFEKIKLLI